MLRCSRREGDSWKDRSQQELRSTYVTEDVLRRGCRPLELDAREARRVLGGPRLAAPRSAVGEKVARRGCSSAEHRLVGRPAAARRAAHGCGLFGRRMRARGSGPVRRK